MTMKRTVITALVLAAIATVACRDSSAPASALAVTMASAYSAAPAGFTNLSTTYTAATDGGFLPEFDHEQGHGHGFGGRGPGPGFGLGFMGGGLFGPFLGDDVGFFFHADSACAYSGSTGVTTCGPVT